MKAFSETVTETDGFLLQLYDYKMPKKDLERTRSEQDVILKVMKASLKHLDIKLSLAENERRLLEKTIVEVMRKYGKDEMVVGRSVVKLLKSLPTRPAAMTMCISGAIPKICMKPISQWKYFSKHIRQNWLVHSKQRFGRVIDIDG